MGGNSFISATSDSKCAIFFSPRLFLNDNLNVDDPYVVVPIGTTFDPNTIYYTHSNIYLFERYSYTDSSVPATFDVYNSYATCSENLKQLVENDWASKVESQTIYTKKTTG